MLNFASFILSCCGGLEWALKCEDVILSPIMQISSRGHSVFPCFILCRSKELSKLKSLWFNRIEFSKLLNSLWFWFHGPLLTDLVVTLKIANMYTDIAHLSPPQRRKINLLEEFITVQSENQLDYLLHKPI